MEYSRINMGRRQQQLERVGIYDKEKLRLVAIASDLLRCSEVSRQEGLLALEHECERFFGDSEFLPFAIRFFLQAFVGQTDVGRTVGRVVTLLNNYAGTLPDEQNEGPMVVAALEAIISGESPVMIKEIIASYIGMDYWEKIIGYKPGQYRRDEIQTILRNLDNAVFTAAMCGASGAVVVAFMANISDLLLAIFSEDITNWKGTEEEILEAQRKVVEIRNRCCQSYLC